jgi:hypothetical protein
MRTLVLSGLLIAGMAAPLPASAQAPGNPAARCAELGALFDRYAGRRNEGSSPNIERAGAALDCQKGNYERGIRTLEEMLRRNAITVPPAS